ncbi:MAG TPA: DUF4325 domain-containing protein [Myxococcales bacterium]
MKTEIVNGIVKEALNRQETIGISELMQLTGLTRQALHTHLKRLIQSGDLVAEGRGRATRYRAKQARHREHSYRREGLSESDVFAELEPELVPAGSTAQAKEIVQYAFTELLNNAIDHSGSPDVEVLVDSTPERLSFDIVDRGVGIFARAQQAHHLDSELTAVQELSKGKLTSQPERHTGEGIFFVSKAVDRLEIESGNLRWTVDNLIGDQALRSVPERVGTRVHAELAAATERALKNVFDEYTKDFAFTKTRAVVKLFEHGVSFVSRSEAKRLLQGMERFSEILLDFQGVNGIGQGFADEVFRVWAKDHPAIAITPVNMAPAVEFMVRRGLG